MIQRQGRSYTRSGRIQRSHYDRPLSPGPPIVRQLSLQRGGSGISDYVRLEHKTFAELYPQAELIGTGSFGQVWKARRGQEELVAVKELDFNVYNEFGPKDVKEASKEIEIQRKIQCSPYSSTLNCAILPIYDAFYNPRERKLYIEMQYVDGRSLEQLFAGIPLFDFTFDAAVLYPNFVRLVRTLQQMHLAGILHRDIKPANILYENSSGLLYLADFGISCEKPNCGDTLGDTCYRDPRLLSHQIAAPDESSDLFALGLTFLQAITRQSILELADTANCKPFTDVRVIRRAIESGLRVMLSKLQQYKQRPEQDLIRTDLDHVILLADIIAHMIQEEQEKRWSLQEIIALLNVQN